MILIFKVNEIRLHRVLKSPVTTSFTISFSASLSHIGSNQCFEQKSTYINISTRFNHLEYDFSYFRNH